MRPMTERNMGATAGCRCVCSSARIGRWQALPAIMVGEIHRDTSRMGGSTG